MDEKFLFTVDPKKNYPWWLNFSSHCCDISVENHWHDETVINYQLRPYGARLIQPKTYNPYLRFDREADFTIFQLRWA